MEVIRYPLDARPASWVSPILALGNFDGLHRGHMTIVQRVVQAARDRGATPVLLTFDPHPTRITRVGHEARLLMTTAQKIDALADSGIAGTVIVHFTSDFSHWEPDRFVETVLVDWLGISEVWVGANFLFGRNRTGDFSALRRLGEKFGYAARKVESVLFGDFLVSSSRIRQLVTEGNVDEAAGLLGHRYYIDGRVVHGDGRGRRIGYPTANLETQNELLPKRGVYATLARVNGQVWRAVTNIGVHPTVGAASQDLVEVHLLEGGRELYGEPLRLHFVKRVRDEKRFGSVDELRAQIAADCDRAITLLCRVSV